MKKKLFYNFLLWLFALPFVFISCGDDNEEPDNETAGWNQKILGEWKLDVNEKVTAIQDGDVEDEKLSISEILSISLEFIDETNVKVSLLIMYTRPGGAFTEISGTYYKYTMSGDNIRFTNIETNEESEMKYDITGSQLYLSHKGGSKFPTLNYTGFNGIQFSYGGPTTAIYNRVEQ